MKTESTNYSIAVSNGTLSPRYVIALSFDDLDTDITYLTSHDDCLDPFSLNLLDYSQWVNGGTGTQLPNFSLVGPVSSNDIITDTGPDGTDELL